jgi:hypothetical protein
MPGMHKILEILASSSAHGIPNIIRTRHLSIKAMWSFFLMGALATLVYFLAKTITDYTDHDVITNINVYREEEPIFPTVSFCINTNNLTITYDQTILYCQFNFKQCNSSEFEIYQSVDRATTCFRYNSGLVLIKTSRSDSLAGLNVFLYTEQSLDEGLYKVSVLVQNSSTLFTREQVYNIKSGLMVPSGATAIAVERKFVNFSQIVYIILVLYYCYYYIIGIQFRHALQ